MFQVNLVSSSAANMKPETR